MYNHIRGTMTYIVGYRKNDSSAKISTFRIFSCLFTVVQFLIKEWAVLKVSTLGYVPKTFFDFVTSTGSLKVYKTEIDSGDTFHRISGRSLWKLLLKDDSIYPMLSKGMLI